MRIAAVLSLHFAVALAWSCNAAAEIYKWVDEKGVTNYGSAPPGKSNAKVLDPQSARVSVYQAPPQQEAARALESALRERMARLESELIAEKRARELSQASSQSEAERRQLAYDQCVRDRHVDCDQIRDGVMPSYPYYTVTAPVYLVGRPRPVRPHHPMVKPAPVFGPAVHGGGARQPARRDQPRPFR